MDTAMTSSQRWTPSKIGAGVLLSMSISVAMLSFFSNCVSMSDLHLHTQPLGQLSANALDERPAQDDVPLLRPPHIDPIWLASLTTNPFAAWTLPQDQDGFYRRGRRRGYNSFDEVAVGRDRGGVPMWDVDRQFQDDVFTFARLKYTSAQDVWGRPQWAVDYPESDYNLSYRLQELTSLKVAPQGVVIQLTDPNVFDYPFLYLIEPGQISLTEAEVEGMRKYLERGGFIMVDDFWGEYEWNSFERQMKIVLPDRRIEDVPLSHEIFQLVYQLKEKPQIPSIGHYMRGYTSDRWDAPFANYRCIKDDEGRIMVMICHNTDLGDGWEREGVDEGYFKAYSEKFAYPLGINIVMYALTR